MIVYKINKKSFADCAEIGPADVVEVGPAEVGDVAHIGNNGGLLLFKDTTIGINARLQSGPKLGAGQPHLVHWHGLPLMVDGGLHGVDVGVVDGVGLAVNV